MSLFAHYAPAARAAAGEEKFELGHARYVAMPALMWAAAAVVALVLSAVQTVPAAWAAQVPDADACVCMNHGA